MVKKPGAAACGARSWGVGQWVGSGFLFRHWEVRILPPQPVIKYLILDELLSFRSANFHRYFRGLAVPCHGAVCSRDGTTRHLGRSRHENLSGAISWLSLFAGGAADAK